MPPPVGFKQLMAKIEMVEDQCSDESDRANRNKKKLQDKEQQSTDPFVQKKMAIQEKIAETKSHVDKRADLLSTGGKGSVDTVKASAAIRKDLKELEQLKQELNDIHQAEEKKAIKKARSKPGGEEVVKANIAKRDEILQVIQENIDDLRFQERSGGQGGGAASGAAGGAAGRDRLMGSKSQAKTRPKPPTQNLDEMDAGTEGLDQAFLQIKKNDQELDQELDLVHQGVKRLGVMAQEMNTELKIQNAMINETKQKAEDVNEHLLQVNKKMKRALDESGGASKMCLNIICLIILLSVVGYIYKLLN